jgi:predicted esterase
VSGDTLSAIASRYLGEAGRHPEIYAANQALIEAAAREHPGPPVFGTSVGPSGPGHWIFPGTVLAIPGATCPATEQPEPALCAEPTFLLAARGSGEKSEAEFPGSHNLGGEPAKPATPRRSAQPAKPSALSVLYEKLNQPVGSAGVYGVPYKAIPAYPSFYNESHYDSDHPTVPASTLAGAKLLADEISKHAACHNQKILLAGYSQGAVVVREAVKMLPPDVQNRISGIALFGDPVSLKGVQVGAPLPETLEDRTVSQCAQGDPICDTSLSEAERKAILVRDCGLFGACPHYNYPGGLADLAAVQLRQMPRR